MGGDVECRDFMQRLIGFFDYYLKDAPMPEWMKGDNNEQDNKV